MIGLNPGKVPGQISWALFQDRYIVSVDADLNEQSVGSQLISLVQGSLGGTACSKRLS